jgi:hypothetical protein
MAEQLRIYVAATADLEPQRSIIAHLLAHLPIQIGAEIRRCPPEGASYDDLFELISNVDRVYFLMGKDITAPAGVEWDLAMQLQRPTLPLRRRHPITPSAFLFITQAMLQVPLKAWRFFSNDLELARIIAQDLLELLLHPQNRYGLTLGETLLLDQRLQAVRAGQWPGLEDLPPELLQEGGVILDARPDLDNPFDDLPVFTPSPTDTEA